MRLSPGWKRLTRSATPNLHISKCRDVDSSPCVTIRGFSNWCTVSDYPSKAAQLTACASETRGIPPFERREGGFRKGGTPSWHQLHSRDSPSYSVRRKLGSDCEFLTTETSALF